MFIEAAKPGWFGSLILFGVIAVAGLLLVKVEVTLKKASKY
jgi:hypothetical protein